MRILFKSAVLALATFAVTAAASAQQPAPWPNRPVKIIHGGGPGGAADISLRKLTEPMAQALGQQIIVESVPGAGGSIAVAQVAKATPDGYTFLQSTNGIIAGQSAMRTDLTYDVLRDLIAVSTTVDQADVIAVSTKNIQATTMRDFIALAKANPGKFTYGSSGIGSTGHIEMERFMREAGIKMEHAPYRSGPEASTALAGGHIDAIITAPDSIRQHLDAGNARGLGVTFAERLPGMQQIPPISDVIPGFVTSQWNGVFAPTGTPQPIVDRMSQLIRDTLKKPDVAIKFTSNGDRILGSTPAEFDKLVREELKAWVDIVKAANIKMQ